MNIVITGANGLIGAALHGALIAQGHRVFAMRRNDRQAPFNWYQDASGAWQINWDESQAIDAVIHLAGEAIGSRWSTAKKQRICNSRIGTTQALVETFAHLETPPCVFLSGSAIGYYGDCGDTLVDERATVGTDFLAQLANNWEQSAQYAQALGMRVVNLRTGLVLSPDGGALKPMVPSFKLGFGAGIGDGRQWMSWVSITEIVAMIVFLLHHPDANGPVNLVSKHAETNADFTSILASTFGKKSYFSLPPSIVKMLFGEMGELLLLGSTRVYPRRLEELGYPFEDTKLSETFAQLFHCDS